MPAVQAAIVAPQADIDLDPLEGAVEIALAGSLLHALPDGSLWCAAERLLVVSDLHFEKASSFARRGQLLPPYDTTATLAALSAAIDRLDPACVVALGDSFHDNGGAIRMNADDRGALSALQRGRDWIWIAGNHDDALPPTLAGDHATEIKLSGITLRHEPSEESGAREIAGHLHPAARVAGRGGSVRRRCFVSSADRMIMPAFGALAGGLNVLKPAFAPFFPGDFTAYVLGSERVYPVARGRLAGG